MTDKMTNYCSFCGKGEREVAKLIAGPAVLICDECVDLCNDIVAEERKAQAKATLMLWWEGRKVSLPFDNYEAAVAELARRMSGDPEGRIQISPHQWGLWGDGRITVGDYTIGKLEKRA